MKNFIETRSTQFDPLNNFFFYKIFGEKGDEVQLLGFINAVLGKTENDKFVSVDILENKSFIADFLGGKSCILDVRARLQNGTMVNIEVQLRNQYNLDRRSLFYFSKEYTNDLESGDDYIELPNVIAINIVDYDFPKTNDFHSCFRLREDTEQDIILTDALEVHFINMVKYRKQGKNKQGLDDPLCRWLAWFNKKSSPEILEEVVKMDAAIQNADSRMTSLTKSQEEMDTYRRMQMAEWDRRCELHYTRKERDNEIARNLLTEGSTPEFVQKITGLSLEEIAKL
ncbi:MAG: Rpn family recombination-promoting nuclease/putative transposase [Treponema sp.]|nr:Rpn family recombination-promoting nuclease/putative transposase [Treponema sp.]